MADSANEITKSIIDSGFVPVNGTGVMYGAF